MTTPPLSRAPETRTAAGGKFLGFVNAVRARKLGLGVALLLTAAAAAGLVGGISRHGDAATENPTAMPAPNGFTLLERPKLLPEFSFKDGDDNTVSLATFRGKVVLLNVWATWCPPCREEMPTLDRLQARVGGEDFTVLPLSIDATSAAAITDFYAETGIKHLGAYIDSPGVSMDALRIRGIPATLLIDRQGREVGRMLGPAEWDSPEFLTFFRSYIGAGAPTPTK